LEGFWHPHPTVQIRIGGLLRRDGTPWHERTRDGYFEIVSPDRHLMRGIWTMTKAYVKESLVLDNEHSQRRECRRTIRAESPR
jgi:hypothetical protein